MGVQNLGIFFNGRGHINILEDETIIAWILEMYQGFNCLYLNQDFYQMNDSSILPFK